MTTLGARLLTEFLGSFLLFTVIALSGGAGSLAPLAIGGALTVLVYMGGPVSGAHYNPAVSLALFLRHRLGTVELVTYWAAQLTAGLLAFGFGYLLTGGAGGIHPGPGVGPLSALAVEALFTFALGLVVLNLAAMRPSLRSSFAGPAIGLTIGAAAYAGGPLSGGAFNPAAGLGATVAGALFGHGGLGDLWYYVVGPVLGAAVAAGAHGIWDRGVAGEGARPQGALPSGAPAPAPQGEPIA